MLPIFLTTVALLFIIGFFYMITTRNMIRTMIALEVLFKGVTLLLITVGSRNGQIATSQSIVITVIIVEVVMMLVAAGIILNLFHHTGSLDTRDIRYDKD